LISFILSGNILFAGASVIRHFDPTFSIRLVELLFRANLTTWLLMALPAGIIFGVLSLLPASAAAEAPRAGKTNDEGQLSH
jgi:hypothetical protein